MKPEEYTLLYGAPFERELGKNVFVSPGIDWSKVRVETSPQISIDHTVKLLKLARQLSANGFPTYSAELLEIVLEYLEPSKEGESNG